ncbi:MAG: hypothetical protein FJ191_03205 [Gammaproteobacteria bacterium]|nr:hypothetical protein [Gammaproteobacteria bacterium]
MADTGKYKRIPEDVREMARFAEQQQMGHGKIEFDELGNAVWVPYSGAESKDVMRKLLDDPNLAFSNEFAGGTVRRISQNPQGLKQGYDPYDSGLLLKKQWKKKKDLRRLSQWIRTRKPQDE